MTTFTTKDRILAEKDGSFTINVEGGIVTTGFKDLTDEEIRHIQAICHLKDVGYDNFIMRFARAILKKARE